MAVPYCSVCSLAAGGGAANSRTKRNAASVFLAVTSSHVARRLLSRSGHPFPTASAVATAYAPFAKASLSLYPWLTVFEL